MQNIRAYITATLSLAAVTACGTTSRFVDQPRLSIDESDKDARAAVGELFELTPPYSLTLGEADSSSKQCKKESRGITATGVGGLLLPLTLHVRGISVQRQTPSADGLAFDASLDAKVDAISPLCGTADSMTAAECCAHHSSIPRRISTAQGSCRPVNTTLNTRRPRRAGAPPRS